MIGYLFSTLTKINHNKLKNNQLHHHKNYWNTFWHIGYKINKNEQDRC